MFDVTYVVVKVALMERRKYVGWVMAFFFSTEHCYFYPSSLYWLLPC